MRKTAKHIVQRVSTLGRPGWRFFLFNKQRRNLSRWDFLHEHEESSGIIKMKENREREERENIEMNSCAHMTRRNKKRN